MKIINGIPSNSASLTDIIQLLDKDNKLYILKMYIDKYKNTETKIGEYYRHEFKIYEYLKKYLIENNNYQIRNILPIEKNFSMSFLDFYKKLCTDVSLMDSKLLLINLILNTAYMFELKNVYIKRRDRDSITDKTALVFRKNIDINVKEKLNKINPKQLNQLNNFKISLKSDPIDLHSIVFGGIISPKLENYNFSDYIKTQPEIENIYDYLFIIGLTSYSMANLGINQNDLHWNNILMDKNFVPKNRNKQYMIYYNDEIIPIDLEYTPYIYDFDRGAIRGKYIKFLQNTRSGGNCPNFNEKRDLLKTICKIYHQLYNLNSKDYRKKANELLNCMIKDQSLVIKLINTKISCWFELDYVYDSYLCEDNQLNKVESWEFFLQYLFMFSSIKKKSVSIKDIKNKNKNTNELKKFIKENSKNYSSIKEYIKNNLQHQYLINNSNVIKNREKIIELLYNL